MTSIKECFAVILRGDEEESRQAARMVRKLLYSSTFRGRGKFVEIANLINHAPEEYAKISEDWRQEHFVLAISVIYYLHDKESEPDFLFPWLFFLLKHPNGNIRHAAVKMLSIETGPLTVHIRFPGHKHGLYGKLKPEQADRILFSLYMSLQEVLTLAWNPAYKKFKYISSLPSSSYKSGQQVLARLEELCGREYVDNMIQRSNA